MGNTVCQTSTPAATSRRVNIAEISQEKNKEPTIDESWEVLQKAVARHDDAMVKNWKEDIDTLLVFVRVSLPRFTMKHSNRPVSSPLSYQWLSEDPADITVALLIQISAQLNMPQSVPAERPPFEADSSSLRINCFGSSASHQCFLTCYANNGYENINGTRRHAHQETHEVPKIRGETLGLLRFFEDAWGTYPEYNQHQHKSRTSGFDGHAGEASQSYELYFRTTDR